jgi:hypothetical protein
MSETDAFVDQIAGAFMDVTVGRCGLIAQLAYSGAVDHVRAKRLLQETPNISSETADELSRIITAKLVLHRRHRKVRQTSSLLRGRRRA